MSLDNVIDGRLTQMQRLSNFAIGTALLHAAPGAGALPLQPCSAGPAWPATSVD